MSRDKKNIERTKEALSTLTPSQALLISNTMQNLGEGSYWSIFTQKEFEKVFGVSFNDQEAMDKLRTDLSVISSVEAIARPDGSWSILATYANVEDFFTLFHMINPGVADKIEKLKRDIYDKIQENVSSTRTELSKRFQKAIKKGDPYVPVAIYSLNKSGTTKVKLGEKEKTIKSFAIDYVNFLSILDQVASSAGVSYTLNNPITGESGKDISSFIQSNSTDTGGIYTMIILS